MSERFLTQSEEEGPSGLALGGERREAVEHGHQVVLRDGVEEARRRDETLQAGAGRRHETANEDGPFVRPGEIGHHQTAADALAESKNQQKKD